MNEKDYCSFDAMLKFGCTRNILYGSKNTGIRTVVF